MASDRWYAVLDIRERGEFNECQISNATSLPRSQLEFRIGELFARQDGMGRRRERQGSQQEKGKSFHGSARSRSISGLIVFSQSAVSIGPICL